VKGGQKPDLLGPLVKQVSNPDQVQVMDEVKKKSLTQGVAPLSETFKLQLLILFITTTWMFCNNLTSSM
jgi:hypothetical protein